MNLDPIAVVIAGVIGLVFYVGFLLVVWLVVS